ncbi:MAG TPA: hypothetical protein VLA90_04395, partial [Actinomycetota bacterium]|nr:hypothetical protein [Actinomycetota bacterium]
MRAMRAAAMAVGATVALALAPPVGATEEPGSEQGATGRVRIVDNRFRPRSVTVERGTRVRWSNA